MVLTAVLVAASLSKHIHEPKWMDKSLAGYAFQYDTEHAPVMVHDPRSGYFLVRETECDGGEVTLLLTRDHHMVANFDVNVQDGGTKSVDKPLRNLSTGKGIAIGDSELKLTSILGGPSNKEIEGSRKQFLVYSYKWNQPAKNKHENDTIYEESYTFKKGKLIEIQFFKSSE